MLTEAEKQSHLTGIGSSSAWYCLTAPMDAYLLHTGQARIKQTTGMRLGNALEGGIAEVWSEENRRTIRTLSTQRHPERHWQIAHIDRWIEEDECPLEVKYVDGSQAYLWGDEGTDQVPENYLIQVQHQMAVMGVNRARVAACIGTRILTFEVPRDEDLIDLLTEAERKLWVEHIEPRIPPPLSGSSLEAQWMQTRFPMATEPARRAVGHELEIIEDFKSKALALNATKQAFEIAKLRVQEAIGSSTGLYIEDGPTITWKPDKNGKRSIRHPWTKNGDAE